MRPYGGRIAGLALLSTAEVGLRILSPWPLKAIVDDVLGSGSLPPSMAAWIAPLGRLAIGVHGDRERFLAGIVLAGILLQVLHQMVLMYHSRLTASTGQHMVRDLRERLFAHLQALTLAQHARTPSGDQVYRLESDACCLEHLFLRGVFPMVFSALTLVAMFSVLIGIDLPLTLVSLAVMPLLFVWLKTYTRRMRPHATRAKELESELVQRLHESVTSIRLVKTYAREDFEQQRFSIAATRVLAARLVTTRQESLFAAVVTTITIAGTSAVVLLGGLSVLHGRITLGTLLLLIAYLGFVYGPLCGIANTTGALQQAVASARRVRETFALATEPLDAPGAIDAGPLHGEVTFDRVSFAYDGGRPVLSDVSFTVRPGELVALVGPSGAGKSTIVSLMTRLYEPTAGRVLIDGRDVRDFKLRALRRSVAMVLQDAIALSGSIRDNLRFGRIDATDAEIESAARAAHAHDFIQQQAHGYDTPLGEGGSGLSGGQRQRLGIARAFLKDAPILVLDEPTASLDAISEQLVFDGLERLHAGRTTFVIAHRLSTVANADRIFVMDAGRIVAEGTHERLLRESPLYAQLASRLTVSRDAFAAVV